MHIALVAAETATAVPLDTVAIATLVSFFIPLLVSLITKRTASDGLKSVVNIVATALVAVVAIFTVPLPPGVMLSWTLIVNTFIASIVSSIVGYKGVWKPTGVTITIEAKTPNVGLGSPPVMETPEQVAADVAEGDLEPPVYIDAEVWSDEDLNEPVDWDSIPAVDDYEPRLDREPDMVPDEKFHPELKEIEKTLTEIGDSPEGQAFRDAQPKE